MTVQPLREQGSRRVCNTLQFSNVRDLQAAVGRSKQSMEKWSDVPNVMPIQADITRLLTLPPGAFRPAPKVHSAVVRLTFKPSVVPAHLFPVFERMVRMMFTQRRKTLSNALRPFAESIGRESKASLESAGIDPVRRPETLDLTELVRLAAALAPKA